MRRDYFTRAEFLEFAGDPEGAKYGDDAIDRAQDEVIEALESWAHSSWPNVPEVGPEDGDGTAAAPRSTTETFDGDVAEVTLENVPVIEATTITIGDTELDVTEFDVYGSESIVGFGSNVGSGRRAIVVEYTFGHTSTPWAIKRPVMQATKSLLDGQPGKSKIPARTSRYQTGSTTIERDTTSTDVKPWPWDDDASKAVRSYWGPFRPVNVGAA